MSWQTYRAHTSVERDFLLEANDGYIVIDRDVVVLWVYMNLTNVELLLPFVDCV